MVKFCRKAIVFANLKTQFSRLEASIENDRDNLILCVEQSGTRFCIVMPVGKSSSHSLILRALTLPLSFSLTMSTLALSSVRVDANGAT